MEERVRKRKRERGKKRKSARPWIKFHYEESQTIYLLYDRTLL